MHDGPPCLESYNGAAEVRAGAAASHAAHHSSVDSREMHAPYDGAAAETAKGLAPCLGDMRQDAPVW